MSGWVEETANKTGFALHEDEIVTPIPNGWAEVDSVLISYSSEIPVPILHGGTGYTTKEAGFGALAPDSAGYIGVMLSSTGSHRFGAIAPNLTTDRHYLSQTDVGAGVGTTPEWRDFTVDVNTLAEAAATTAATEVTQLAIDALIGTAPELLDTLGELSDALGDDADYAATVTTALERRLLLSGGTMTGNIDMDSNAISNVSLFSASSMDNGALTISAIDGSSSLGAAQNTLPTQGAVKAYVDAHNPTHALNDISGVTYTGTSLAILGLDTITTVGSLALDIDGDITLDANGGQVWIKDDDANHFLFDCDNTAFWIYDDVDAGDLFGIQVADDGETTISTVDDGVGGRAHLHFDIDGSIKLDDGTPFVLNKVGTTTEYGQFYHSGDDFLVEAVDQNLIFKCDSGKLIEFHEDASLGLRHDGSTGSTKFTNDANNYFEVRVTTDGLTTLTTNDGGVDHDGNLSLIPDGELILNAADDKTIRSQVAIGFDKTSTAIGASSTTIDFRDGNKAELRMLVYDNTALELQFPLYSGNFTLVLEQYLTGSLTLSSWKALDSAGNDANNDGGTAGAVRWAGGTAPTLSTAIGSFDIVSFYWDAPREICFAVPSLDFS